MKKLLRITLLAALVGCHTTEDISDELTDAQLAAIDAYAAQQCITNTATRYDNFETVSARAWQSDSAKWQRNYGWKYLLKQGETILETQEIRVWRNTGDDLYLLVRRLEASNDTSYFLRLPLTLNTVLVEDVQYQGCNQLVTITGGESGPLSAKKILTENLVPGKRETTTTFTFDFTLPAFTGGAWKFSRSVVISGANGTTYTNGTTTVTGTLSEWAGNPALNETPAAYATKYCDVQPSTADTAHPTLEYKVPFGVEALASCADTSAGWTDF